MKVIVKILSIMALATLGAYAFNYNTTLVNHNPDARGIKKLIIRSNGMVKAVGLCHTGRCDWGWTDYIRTQNGLLATWKRPGRGCKVVLVESTRHNQARVITKTLRSDGRRDRTKIEFFRKQHRHIGHATYAYEGSWVNEEGVNRGLESLRIYHRGNQIMVHARTQCRQAECDWGRSAAALTQGKLVVQWNRGPVTKVMTIRGMDRDRYGEYQTMKVKIRNSYRDGRAPKTRIFFLTRER